MLALGLSVAGIYVLATRFSMQADTVGPFGYGAAHDFFLLMLILLATGLASANYQHRKAEFNALQQAVRAAEALTGGQLRAQLAENAISIGKLAATLTHEINTPLGAMRSSIQTLLAITDRQADAPPERREILNKMRNELCQSIQESAGRIESVLARLRRFVTLEEAELKSADINDLLSDVALLYQEQIAKGQIRLEFDMERPLPELACRPQLLSAVFSSLLSNAINAVNGGGRIGIVTRRNDSAVRVTVSDNGRGMTPEEADGIFEPSFKVAAGRVSSGNWSLFNTRQIVYEHGGEIRIDTALGKGTAFHVTLPLG
jgi:signal transduction histidine kinase